MKTYARPLIAVLALVALGASITALYVHYQILRDPTYTSFCEISEQVSCEAVLESPYAAIAGVPVAVGGAVWAGLVFLLAAVGMGTDGSGKEESSAGGYVFLLATVGLSAVLYLGYASFFLIGKACVICLTMYASVIGIFIVSGATSVSLLSLPGRLGRDLKSVATHPVTAALALAYVVGSVLVAFFPRQAPPAEASGSAAPAAATEVIAADQLAEFDKWIEAQPRVQLPVSADGAQVLVVKFNDYQCPSCRQTYVEYKSILDKFKADGRVKFVTMDFPLDSECNTAGIHGSACEAAAAVRMARARNKGEAMEEFLFNNQERFSPDFVKNAVKDVAKVTDFDAQYPKVLEAIRADAALGRQLGVQATPTFFINGLKISGGLRPAYFEAVIAHELKKAGATS